ALFARPGDNPARTLPGGLACGAPDVAAPGRRRGSRARLRDRGLARVYATTTAAIQPSPSPTAAAPRLLERRLLFVLGKGGVGRSTIAAALGVLAARRGQRAIVVEVSARGDVPRLFGASCEPGVETELRPGLWTLAVDPRLALIEYLRDQLPGRALAELVSS